MAEVLIPVRALETGELPPICVKTGRPVDELTAYELNVMPSWSNRLLLGGPVNEAVFRRTSIAARLPVASGVMRRVRRSQRIAVIALVVFVASFGLDPSLHRWNLDLLSGLSSFAAWLVLVIAVSVRVFSWVYVTQAPNNQQVKLAGVHPDFETACRKMFGAQPPTGATTN